MKLIPNLRNVGLKVDTGKLRNINATSAAQRKFCPTQNRVHRMQPRQLDSSGLLWQARTPAVQSNRQGK